MQAIGQSLGTLIIYCLSDVFSVPMIGAARSVSAIKLLSRSNLLAVAASGGTCIHRLHTHHPSSNPRWVKRGRNRYPHGSVKMRHLYLPGPSTTQKITLHHRTRPELPSLGKLQDLFKMMACKMHQSKGRQLSWYPKAQATLKMTSWKVFRGQSKTQAMPRIMHRWTTPWSWGKMFFLY